MGISVTRLKGRGGHHDKLSVLRLVFVLGVSVFLLPACTHGRRVVNDVKPGAHVRDAALLYRSRQDRLNTVLYPLLLHNAGLCGQKTHFSLGIVTEDAQYQHPHYGPVLRSLDGGSAARVRFVGTGTQAERAGVRAGDEIVAVNGRSFFPDSSETSNVMSALGMAAEKGKSVVLEIRRGGELLELKVSPERMCSVQAAPLNILSGSKFSEDDFVYVCGGLMRLCRADWELAVLLGQEMAHVVLRHGEMRERRNAGMEAMNGALGMLLGFSVGGEMEEYDDPFPLAQEIEADVLGLFMAARAGYDVSRAHILWGRLASEQADLRLEGDGPWDAGERYEAIRRVAARIRRLRAEGRELLPQGP